MATLDANGYTVAVNPPRFHHRVPYRSGPVESDRQPRWRRGRPRRHRQNGIPIPNSYTGGTTVLSGTLQVLNNQALPSTGILTVAGPATVVLSAHLGTLFGNNVTGQTLVVASTGVDIASASPAADASGSAVSTLATGVSMAPSGSGPAPVPEPSTLALLGAGLLSLLGFTWRRRKAG